MGGRNLNKILEQMAYDHQKKTLLDLMSEQEKASKPAISFVKSGDITTKDRFLLHDFGVATTTDPLTVINSLPKVIDNICDQAGGSKAVVTGFIAPTGSICLDTRVFK